MGHAALLRYIAGAFRARDADQPRDHRRRSSCWALFCSRRAETALYPEWLLAALLAGSLGLSYLFLYVGIAYDSPTLALVNAIADFGDEGMPVAELDVFIAHHPFVTTRLAALSRSGMLALDGDRWLLRDRVGPLLRLGEAYQATVLAPDDRGPDMGAAAVSGAYRDYRADSRR